MSSVYQNLPDTYYVGHIRIQPNIVLAPMVGVTDSIFRRMILRLGGCGLVSSEMTNAASVSPRARSRHNQLEFLPEERPITMQLSGNDPELVANAARTVEQIGADILDINCGCPSPKVTGGGHGSALLKDLCKMEQLLKEVIKAVQIPVTLKYRAGWDDNSLNYLDTARMAESVGVKALALHPRTRAQLYTGSADWSRVAEVRQVVSIPVLGSGDVKDAAEALRRLEVYQASGIMIGRGAMENPWIFMQTAQLRRGEPVFEPQAADKCEFLFRYLDIMRNEIGDRLALNKLKQLIGQFGVGLPGAAKLREAVHRADTPDLAKAHIEAFFEPHLNEATPAV
jgi:nifR3 family TIM-barrel protein